LGTFQISRDIGPLISAAKERKKVEKRHQAAGIRYVFLTYFSIYFTICSFLKIKQKLFEEKNVLALGRSGCSLRRSGGSLGDIWWLRRRGRSSLRERWWFLGRGGASLGKGVAHSES
jgi:hypothetical protein